MKKVMMTLVAAMITVAASAQVYVGGSLGIGSVKLGGNDAKTSFKIVPEIGYNINDEWAVGLAIGYQQGECKLGKADYLQETEMKLFGVNPYVRNTFLRTKYV
ncbi:MAG: outer membrane beta-barrel protein, partial [Lachnospiraceae bacterium]|nr:outer membrane beta-barrel protein [Lachnospiraceae bacterium]